MAELHVAARVDSRSLDVRFSVAAGEVLAVMGPNGSGKSTTAGVIAGLVPADAAVVRVGDRSVTDTARGVHVPPHDRRIGLLLQKPLLFPHLTVQGNVEFGARQRVSRAEARARATSWLGLVGAADLASRRPGQLSGGQAQRVAIARALAAEPAVLVLDEPLAGLDVEAAASVRAVLRQVLTAEGRSAILITHDLLDVLALADRVLVLEGGQVAEIGTSTTVLATPHSSFGARMAGVNLVRGVLSDTGALETRTGALETPSGQTWHGVLSDGPARPAAPGGRDGVAVFPPSAVAIYRAKPQGSPRNTFQVTVADLEVSGSVVRVRARQPDLHSDGVPDNGPVAVPGLAADITCEAAAELRLAVGEPVWFAVKAQEVRLQSARPARHD